MKKIVGHLRAMTLGKAEPAPTEVMLAFCGSCAALAIIGLLHELVLQEAGLPLLMAPFGASAVLVFGAPDSPLAQPRNVVGGHVVSALVGIGTLYLLDGAPHITPALAVSGAIAAMHLTGTLHPPGGGTALLVATDCPAVAEYGFFTVIFPVGTGMSILVLIALIINNLARDRRYPVSWW